jgi:DNA-binding MurR/RpiR family transcriptional regulator
MAQKFHEAPGRDRMISPPPRQARARRASPRALLVRRLQEARDRLSPKHSALASFLLKEYRRAAFMTAAELAVQLQMSSATIVRFAVSIGYRGYPDLRRHLHQIVQEDLTGTDLFALHLSRGEPNPLHSLVQHEIENLSRLPSDAPPDELERLAGLVARARRVFVVGLRASASLAQYLGYHLAKIHPQVVTTVTGEDVAFDALSSAGAADVMVAIGFPRYPRATIELMDLARREGLFVAAITDSVLSPLAKRADITIPVRIHVASFVDSFAAPQVLLALLLGLVSVRDQSRTEAGLRRFEETAVRRRLFHSED